MDFAKLRYWLRHRNRTLVFLALFCTFLYFRRPFNLSDYEVGLFSLVVLLNPYFQLLWISAYSGYGVDRNLEVFLGIKVVKDYKGFCCGGWIIGALAERWMRILGQCLSIAAGSLLAMFFFQDPAVTVMARLGLVYTLARLLGVLAEIYFWFVEDRYRLWPLAETQLRATLLLLNVADHEVNKTLKDLAERGWVRKGL